MTNYFTFKEKSYNFIWASDVTADDLPKKKTYKQSRYLDIGCGFDIETSRVNEYEKLSTMYVWQFSLNEITVIGRTYEELRQFLNLLTETYELDTKHRLLCFIHNMSYEWSFIKGQIEWNTKNKHPEVFATDSRNIIKACTKGFIEFRDSYILTQRSLASLSKAYNLDVEKLSGEVDYSLIRHSGTELTDADLAYSINDVQILSSFYHKYVKKQFIVRQHKIPLTSTGIVRQELRRSFKKFNKKERIKYIKKLKRGFPDLKEYEAIIRWLYRGGYVHSNVALTDYKFNSFLDLFAIGMDDIKSSYPASLLHNPYCIEFIKSTPEWFYKFGFDRKIIEEYAYYGTFEFINIRNKSSHSIESQNKLLLAEDCLYDNGRLIKGKKIRVILNEIDMLNYLDFYEWDEIKCLNLRIGTKEELPTFLKDIILEYFYKKETVKDKVERNIVKSMLNSVYGMCVSGLLQSDLIYNPELKVMLPADKQREYEAIIEKEILSPYVGIWCTSYSRRAVLQNIKRMGYDTACYTDTDSIKHLCADGNKWVFETYNDRMRRINKNMYTGNYDPKYFSELGCFEDETKDGRVVYWKVLGAKRYVYTSIENGKLVDHVTIAGMKKGSLQKYCNDYDLDIYDTFSNNLRLNEKYSEKLTTSYEDSSFVRDVIDYNGNSMEVYEASCCTLYAIPFAMNMLEEYVNLINTIAAMNDNKLIKRRY